MIARFGAAVKYLLGTDFAGRTLRTYPDDTFLTSYAKSGNTWARFLVASLLHPEEPMTLVKADELIPSTTLSRRRLNSVRRPRVLKSHFPFDPGYRRVIYIVRDPKDVAVSQYYFKIKRGVLPEGYPIEGFVASFLRGEATPYGSWREHVGSWLAARLGDPDFLLLRYEDLHRQTEAEVARIARFFGIEPTAQRIQWAIEQSSADRLRKLEETEASHWDSTKDTRKDASFFRSAKSGDGGELLSELCIEQIESAWGPLMRWLGYEAARGSASGAAYTDFLETVLERPNTLNS
jgi:Sulfotransferase domain